MRPAIFIGVRMKSIRLPGKALLEIKGKTVTEHLIDRLKLARLPQKIVLCTSVNPDDAPLVDIALRNNIEYFRGSEEDKLDRYLNAAYKFGVDFVIITEGDNVFFDPDIIDGIIRLYEKTGADYISCKGLPLGTTPHGLKVEALKKVCEMKSESDTEVWGGYFTDTSIFDVKYLETDPALNHPELRLTKYYPNDYELFKEIFESLDSPGKIFSLRDIVKLLVNNPEVRNINRQEQEAYLQHIKKSATMKLKKSV
jgi:spore coat polysaccharide biosynthesis protein SpsF